MRKLVVLTGLILAIAVLALGNIGTKTAQAQVSVTQQGWQYQYKVWMPQHWQNLAACESGSNPPNWTHNSGTYEGAFGFYYGSWDQFKPVKSWPHSASLATPWQQWRVALRIAAKYGIASPWGCWRGSQHAWVRNGLPEYGTYK